MKFTYLGDHESTTVYGVKFVQGRPTEVKDAFAIQKLSNNSHFQSEEVSGEKLDDVAFDIGSATAQQLKDFAMSNFSVKIDTRMKIETLREQVQAMIDDDADATEV